ncbi:hypothetical protein T4D_3730 [Trichinella pseudospiralis]|uniref:Uncharacterized protein n=1 Tax=Trichinella pseudospiralis TaxID=6337 RepID=A0A0V1F4H3_TRIPS|nr:hypothetical protein T4D_3730 [Trichinella pseudospiralis]
MKYFSFNLKYLDLYLRKCDIGGMHQKRRLKTWIKSCIKVH